VSPRSPVSSRRRIAVPRFAVAALIALVAIAAFAPLTAPYHPAEQPDAAMSKNLPPSLEHPFGTDGYSRDVLSRVIYGARTSLAVAGVSVLVALALGTAVGAVAGFAGGNVDRWLMRGVDAVLSVPRLLLLLVIAAAFGQLSLGGLVLVLGLTGWPAMSRIVRAQVREMAALDHVLAARALGVQPGRILARHVMPGVWPQVLVAATLAVASVIPLEAGLSFLGLGIPAPAPSWGNIMLEGYEQQLRSWWLVVFPGVAIVTTVLAVNVVGERLRESLDPRLRPPV
jgi:peptide/nickel transport system permease protein